MKKSYHHGNLKETLIYEAKKIIEELGIEALTARFLAERCGVSRTALYRHFRDKEALFAALVTEGYVGMDNHIVERTNEIKDFPESFKQAFIAFVEYAVANPTSYKLMFGKRLVNKADHEILQNASNRLYGRLKDSITRGQAEGLIRQENADEIAFGFWSMLHGTSLGLIEGRTRLDRPLLEIAASAWEYLFNGIKA